MKRIGKLFLFMVMLFHLGLNLWIEIPAAVVFTLIGPLVMSGVWTLVALILLLGGPIWFVTQLIGGASLGSGALNLTAGIVWTVMGPLLLPRVAKAIAFDFAIADPQGDLEKLQYEAQNARAELRELLGFRPKQQQV